MSNEPDKIIYSMIRVSKRHGQKEVLKDISLSYFYGAKIGVLGLNGAGKTVLAPGLSIGYLEQEPLAGETRTVREVVEEGVAELAAIAREFEEINARFAEPMEPDEMDALLARQAEVQERMDAGGVWDLESRLEMAMDALRCPPGDMPVNKVSGGERRRVALCRLLLQNPDILLLDEPTNHLDAESVAAASRGRATTPPGWNRSRNASPGRKRPRPSAARPSRGSWNGSICRPRGGTPRARPGSTPTRPCSRTKAKSALPTLRSTSRRDRASARASSNLTG